MTPVTSAITSRNHEIGTSSAAPATIAIAVDDSFSASRAQANTQPPAPLQGRISRCTNPCTSDAINCFAVCAIIAMAVWAVYYSKNN